MEKMYPSYVYKATEDAADGKIKKNDLLFVNKEGLVTVQKIDYEFLSAHEMAACNAEYIKTDAYKVALTDTGEHVISKDDN